MLAWGIVRDGKHLFHPGTICVFSLQWDPEDVNLEGNQDNVEMLRSQAHRSSLGPVVLMSDEEHLEQAHQLRALSQAFVRNGAGINLQ